MRLAFADAHIHSDVNANRDAGCVGYANGHAGCYGYAYCYSSGFGNAHCHLSGNLYDSD